MRTISAAANVTAMNALAARQHIGTNDDNAWFRRIFDPVFLALIVVSCVTAAIGVYRAAGDADGTQPLTFSLYIAGATLPTVWSVLRGLWHPDPEINPLMAGLQRTVVAPLVSVWPAIIVAGITVSLPAVRTLLDNARRPDGWHYTFAPEDGSPLKITMLLGGLVCLIAAMLVGLVLAVVVVLPGLAFFNPKVAVEGNMLDSSEEAMPANTVAMRFMAVLVFLIFAVPALIIFGKDNAYSHSLSEAFRNSVKFFQEPSIFAGDLAWVVGVLLIPIGIVALIVVKVRQKPDLATRAAHGLNAQSDITAGRKALAARNDAERKSDASKNKTSKDEARNDGV